MLPANFLAITEEQPVLPRESLRAFLESSRFTLQMRQNFTGDRKLIRNRRDQCRSPNGDDTSNECCRQISWQLQRNSLCFPENHCAHSSKAAGSPCRCARTSPAKWSEPAIRIGFWFARVS